MNDKKSFLVFLLENRKYALDLDVVERVVPAAGTTPLPEAADHLQGLINIAGHVVPVINMRGLLGLPGREMELEDRFVLARGQGRLMALHVDMVEGVVEFPVHLVEWPHNEPDRDKPEVPGGSAKVFTILGDIVLIQDPDALAEAASLDELEEGPGVSHG